MTDTATFTPTMRITGLGKGSKAKAIKVYHPTLLVRWAFEVVRYIHGFHECADIDKANSDELAQGAPALTLCWTKMGGNVPARIAILQATIAKCEARPLESFLADVQEANERKSEAQAQHILRWDEANAALIECRTARDKLVRAQLGNEQAAQLLRFLESEIAGQEDYLRKFPREQSLTFLPTDEEALKQWQQETLAGLHERLRADQKLLATLTRKGKKAKREILRFLREVVAAELAPEPPQETPEDAPPSAQ